MVPICIHLNPFWGKFIDCNTKHVSYLINVVRSEIRYILIRLPESIHDRRLLDTELNLAVI